jgi:chromate transporter
VKKCLEIFSTMFLIGLFTFGGGLSMIPQMTHIFVHKRGWITEEEIADYFAVSQSLPGVIATNASVMLGYRLAGIPGALCAAAGAVLPSFLVLIIVTYFYQAFISHPVLLGAMRGIRAAVVALLFYTVWGLRKSSVRGVADIMLCLTAAVLVFVLKVNPIWVILAGLSIGIGYSFYKTQNKPIK